MMIEIKIDRDLSLEASLRSEKIPINIRNSITEGKNRFIGCLGEVAVKKHLQSMGSDVSYIGDYEFDLLSNGKRLEVKTKACSSKPLDHYECSVANFNSDQDCDYYVFTRCKNESIYLCGYISPDEFKERAVFMKKGDEDTNIVRGKKFKIRADCYNLPISSLRSFKKDH